MQSGNNGQQGWKLKHLAWSVRAGHAWGVCPALPDRGGSGWEGRRGAAQQDPAADGQARASAGHCGPLQELLQLCRESGKPS